MLFQSQFYVLVFLPLVTAVYYTAARKYRRNALSDVMGHTRTCAAKSEVAGTFPIANWRPGSNSDPHGNCIEAMMFLTGLTGYC